MGKSAVDQSACVHRIFYTGGTTRRTRMSR